MKNKQKVTLGVIAAIVLVGLIGVFVFSQQSGIALNISNNNSTEQGTSSQSSGSSGSSGDQSSSKKSTDSGGKKVVGATCTNCGGTGYIEETTYTQEKCDVCGGIGTMKLSGGQTVDCPYCDGGWNRVPHTVKKTCPVCGGTGKA